MPTDGCGFFRSSHNPWTLRSVSRRAIVEYVTRDVRFFAKNQENFYVRRNESSDGEKCSNLWYS